MAFSSVSRGGVHPGKDPLVAVICLIELLGPCRFGWWATEDDAWRGLAPGEPVAVDLATAWVQIAAVSKKQTQNTMKCFAYMISDDLKLKYRLTVNKESIYAYGGARQLEALTSSPRSMEGNRPTFVVRNETHHWVEANDGHDVADVIERNLEKSKGGMARALSITNAYAPHEHSVAQVQREGWELEQSGVNVKTGVLYDSIEAPAGTALEPPMPARPSGLTQEEWDDLRGEIMIAWLSAIIEKIRGGAHWINPRRIALGILSGRRPISVSKRFWLNVISTAEDAWADPVAVKAAIDPAAEENRRLPGADILRAGWLPMPDEPIVVFGDGSKSDDATALVGCRISDGYTFLLGLWQAPPKVRKGTWVVPRNEVDARVEEIFARFNVVGFWFDPSHAKDDEDVTTKSFWSAMCDTWMRRHRDKLKKELWPVKSGAGAHAVTFDMAGPLNRRLFAEGAEEFAEQLHRLNDIEEYDPDFRICGHPMLVQHMTNAKQYPTSDGTSLAKDGRESPRKIDAAVCAVGARLLRRVLLNVVPEEKPRGGNVWGALG